MATVRETRGGDSDGNGSMTPSEKSDNDERSEHDSDYESDDGDDRLEPKGKVQNIQWTGYGKRVPVILFNAETVLNKRTDFKVVGERYHLAFKFASTDCKIVRNILLSHGFHEVHPNSVEYNLIWSNSHLKPFTLRTMSEFQKINHFPRSYELTRKDRLFKNIQRMQQTKGHKHFDFIPPSYVLPGDYQEFCSNFLKDKGPYIVKPVASSRGRGVFLINHPDQVPLDENVIVSKYVSAPLVIDGFKFDMRIYVAVTSYDPLVIYLYEEGLTRFATVKYEKNVKHMRNQCMHLTNYSVNKRSQDYVKNDDPDVEDYGNKWSMGAMLRYLRSEGKDTAALMMRIEDVVIKTILSVESSIATACKMFQPFRGNCFELYGFDILLDENLKPWVLEVNLSPSLACDSPLDLKIKSNMLCDLFSLVGVICHDPMMRTRQQVNKQASEIAAKLKSRIKGEMDDGTAELLGQIEAARLTMKEADTWLLKRERRVCLPVRKSPRFGRTTARPQSASSSASKERQGSSGMIGLNSEEIKIIRRVREEEARKGGWIRIFPTADSWDAHGSFLQFPTTYNLMLHQRLYPERHKGMTASKTPGTSIIAPSRSKNGIQLQVTGSGKADQEKFIESYTQALLRAKQYERRLGQVKRSRRRKRAQSKSQRNKLVQGVSEAEDNAENMSEEEGTNERGRDKKEQEIKPQPTKPEVKSKSESKPASSTTSSTTAKSTTQSSGSKEAAPPPPEKEPEKPKKKQKEKEDSEVSVSKSAGEPNYLSPSPEPPPPPKYDVIGLLEKGHTLSKVQARTAFAMYLIRVQQRLLSDCGGVLRQEDVDALNEQMDLVLRFLKRAAVNLPQAFRVVVPSKKLPLSDRRRILAKQLGDFVHIYNKETDHLKAVKVRSKMENKKPKRSESCESLDESKFDQFVYTAVEGELEEVLTTYTKINKSAAIFLGGDSKPGANTLSEAKREMLTRRRENPDITDGTVPVGDDPSRFKHANSESPENSNSPDYPCNERKERVIISSGRKGCRCRQDGVECSSDTGVSSSDPYVNNNNNYDYRHYSSAMDLRTGENTGVASRPGSAQHSYAAAVSIYTQKLGRPRSASSSGTSRTGRPLVTRPASAATNRPGITPQTGIFTTSDPIVDTYNEKAIQDALQRLAVRQQARQYSAVNGTNVLKSEVTNMKPPTGMRPCSSTGREPYVHHGMSINGHTMSQAYSRPIHESSGQRYMTMEDYMARSASRQQSGSASSMTRRPSYTGGNPAKPPQPQQTSIHMQNANATFNSFIDDPSNPHWQNDIATAYSEVTGVPPQNYHAASVNSRQYQIAQQQAMKQRMMEQSKAMLEQSKAKHDALVSQAQNQQSSTSVTLFAHGDEMNLDLSSMANMDHGHTHKTLMPKPPEHPAYKQRPPSSHRFNSLMATGHGPQS